MKNLSVATLRSESRCFSVSIDFPSLFVEVVIPPGIPYISLSPSKISGNSNTLILKLVRFSIRYKREGAAMGIAII